MLPARQRVLRLVVLSPVYDGRYRAVHFSVFLSWVPLALASAADPLALHCLFSLIIQRLIFSGLAVHRGIGGGPLGCDNGVLDGESI